MWGFGAWGEGPGIWNTTRGQHSWRQFLILGSSQYKACVSNQGTIWLPLRCWMDPETSSMSQTPKQNKPCAHCFACHLALSERCPPPPGADHCASLPPGGCLRSGLRHQWLSQPVQERQEALEEALVCHQRQSALHLHGQWGSGGSCFLFSLLWRLEG